MQKLRKKAKYYIVCKGGWIIYLDKDGFYKAYKYRWTITKNGSTRYAMRKILNNKTQYIHHFLFGNPKSPLVIDHINKDGLDNRKINVRFVTRSVNALNMKTKGYYKKGDKYISRIWVDNKSRWLGSFNSKKEAARVSQMFKDSYIKKHARKEVNDEYNIE